MRHNCSRAVQVVWKCATELRAFVNVATSMLHRKSQGWSAHVQPLRANCVELMKRFHILMMTDCGQQNERKHIKLHSTTVALLKYFPEKWEKIYGEHSWSENEGNYTCVVCVSMTQFLKVFLGPKTYQIGGELTRKSTSISDKVR